MVLIVLLWSGARAPTPRAAFWSALALGTGYFATAMSWIVEPFLVDAARHGWMAPFALAGMAAGMALFWAVPVALARRVLRPYALAAPLFLSLAEWARHWLFTGLPWAAPGQVLIDTPLAQAAAFIGVLGLSAVLFFAASQLITRRWIAALVLLVNAALPARNSATPPDTGQIVRLIQPNAEQAKKWDREWMPVFFNRALELSAAPGPRDLVVWPETALPSLLGHAPELEARVRAAAGVPVIVGTRRMQGTRFYNSMALLGSEQVYDKRHTVPFGEYVPFGDALGRLGIRGLAVRDGFGYSSGQGAALMDLPGGLGRALPLICYEAIFPRDLAAFAGRADWILQATNDAWFGTRSGPQQHLAQARFRAIEQGLPFLRAANTGISAVIDARGRVLAHLPLNTAGHLDAALPGALPPTLFSRWGNAPLLVLLAALCVVLIALPRPVSRPTH
ncbi:MAG: apolipoprotein N-acyltransferase [Rhodobacterales bacterium]|nr:MAG: apolipoprotein N-acyltransferase [Rhodobacterales bacterium]